ncbi:MAG: hypothetical protein K2P08_07810 [Oscillospiraceae bacterium]|nr:hypothetical protein [Oscillospiraceae bacterium]
MELLQSPPALALWLAAAALTAWGAARHRHIPSFLGGLLWAGGTVCALVDGAGLDGVLAVTLALLLLSAAPWRRRAES